MPPAETAQAHFEALEGRLAPDVAALLAHPLYPALRTLDDVRRLMESHVFAVWDFMSLVKALQRSVTCVEVPWTPPAEPRLARFLNEIVLAEESDEVGPDLYLSHCQLYLRAMEEVGADTRRFRSFLGLLTAGRSVKAALEEAGVPEQVSRFVRLTLETTGAPAHVVAASFLYGRENVIPEMFRRILRSVSAQNASELASLTLYLDRHIAIDADSHGPLAKRLLMHLCGDDAEKWAQAERSARQAIAARILFWDGVHAHIKKASPSLA